MLAGYVTALLLLAAEIVFLTTFLAAEPLEILADTGQIQARDTAYLYASRWRHGMTGDWPMYMPGFFAVALTVWFWALQRNLRQMLREGSVLTLAALVVAIWIQPFGAEAIARQFQSETSLLLDHVSELPSNSAIGLFRSVYTLATFAVGIVSIQIAIARRTLWPLAVPLVMNLILASIRPWTVSDFTNYWMQQVLDLSPVANFSLLAAVSAAVLMFVAQITWSRRSANSFELPARPANRQQGGDRLG
jgi:hypothetical protein